MHRGAWQATVHGVTKSQTWLRERIKHLSYARHCMFSCKPHNLTLIGWGQSVISILQMDEPRLKEVQQFIENQIEAKIWLTDLPLLSTAMLSRLWMWEVQLTHSGMEWLRSEFERWGGGGGRVKKFLLVPLKTIVMTMKRTFSLFQWSLIVSQTTPQCGDINQTVIIAIRCSLEVESSGGSTRPDIQGGTHPHTGLAVDADCHLGGQLSTRVPICGLGLWHLNTSHLFN